MRLNCIVLIAGVLAISGTAFAGEQPNPSSELKFMAPCDLTTLKPDSLFGVVVGEINKYIADGYKLVSIQRISNPIHHFGDGEDKVTYDTNSSCEYTFRTDENSKVSSLQDKQLKSDSERAPEMATHTKTHVGSVQ